MSTATNTWLNGLERLIVRGIAISPRGQQTIELPQQTFVIDMKYPVVTLPERKLSYRFMAAEAYWILSGDDRVSTISPYNKRIADFSDDGVKFFGAYGPRINSQLPYVVTKLIDDNDTRQAGLTIWRESPPATKDVPCTVALFWQIRFGKLNCHAFMRSSDIWLGLPYDMFNFSMLSHKICCHLNEGRVGEDPINHDMIEPGDLYLTAASSHLYARNHDNASYCVSLPRPSSLEHETPSALWLNTEVLMRWLTDARDGVSSSRWWEWAPCQG